MEPQSPPVYRPSVPQSPVSTPDVRRPGVPPSHDRYWLHALLFVATMATTVHAGGTLAGRLLVYEPSLGPWWFVPDGLRYAATLLLFLTVHEFGHYFAARYHRVRTSLPFYIPLPFVGFGTLGAVIRIREPIPSLRKLFDIGVAGPLAGFVVAFGALLVALFTLPGPDYLLTQGGHEALKGFISATGRFPAEMPPPEPGAMTFIIGEMPLYRLLASAFPNVPPPYEMYHYPVLFGAWLGLFFTALNLLPVGQLDGGHLLYALVGPRWHGRLARGFVLVLLASGAIGYVHDYLPLAALSGPAWVAGAWALLAAVLGVYLGRIFAWAWQRVLPALAALMAVASAEHLSGGLLSDFGYAGWLVFGVLIVFVVRVDHPPVLYHEPLTPGRRALALLGVLIFLLCFSIRPLYVL